MKFEPEEEMSEEYKKALKDATDWWNPYTASGVRKKCAEPELSESWTQDDGEGQERSRELGGHVMPNLFFLIIGAILLGARKRV